MVDDKEEGGPDGRADDEEARAQQRLLDARRACGVGQDVPRRVFPGTDGTAPEPSPVVPLPDGDGGDRARRLVARCFGRMRAVGRVNDLVPLQQFLVAVCRGMERIGERALARGLPTDGLVWDALLAWEPVDLEADICRRLGGGSLLVGVLGEYGCGKSALLAHLVLTRPAGSSGIPPRYIAASQLAEFAARPYNEQRRQALRQAEEASCLVIDDVGVEEDGPLVKQVVNRFMLLRFDYGLPTLFSSNLTVKDGDRDQSVRLRVKSLAGYLDERLALRIRTHGSIVHMRGGSRRVRPASLGGARGSR